MLDSFTRKQRMLKSAMEEPEAKRLYVDERKMDDDDEEEVGPLAASSKGDDFLQPDEEVSQLITSIEGISLASFSEKKLEFIIKLLLISPHEARIFASQFCAVNDILQSAVEIVKNPKPEAIDKFNGKLLSCYGLLGEGLVHLLQIGIILTTEKNPESKKLDPGKSSWEPILSRLMQASKDIYDFELNLIPLVIDKAITLLHTMKASEKASLQVNLSMGIVLFDNIIAMLKNISPETVTIPVKNSLAPDGKDLEAILQPIRFSLECIEQSSPAMTTFMSVLLETLFNSLDKIRKEEWPETFAAAYTATKGRNKQNDEEKESVGPKEHPAP